METSIQLYGVLINNILEKKRSLSEPYLAAMGRRVVDSIKEFTLCPCGDSVRIVVHHMFEKSYVYIIPATFVSLEFFHC
jgi:hypothetical protein